MQRFNIRIEATMSTILRRCGVYNVNQNGNVNLIFTHKNVLLAREGELQTFQKMFAQQRRDGSQSMRLLAVNLIH